ncbi:hypothetical protein R3P38DRAFT_2776333 [Favolaschia claudopus]|uniref:Uncharacterized protein n=1 Tax=Favolaschia claudopus TaxID=2862362 RepID=A0AAW0BQ21_9AGAR
MKTTLVRTPTEPMDQNVGTGQVRALIRSVYDAWALLSCEAEAMGPWKWRIMPGVMEDLVCEGKTDPEKGKKADHRWLWYNGNNEERMNGEGKKRNYGRFHHRYPSLVAHPPWKPLVLRSTLNPLRVDGWRVFEGVMVERKCFFAICFGMVVGVDVFPMRQEGVGKRKEGGSFVTCRITVRLSLLKELGSMYAPGEKRALHNCQKYFMGYHLNYLKISDLILFAVWGL